MIFCIRLRSLTPSANEFDIMCSQYERIQKFVMRNCYILAGGFCVWIRKQTYKLVLYFIFLPPDHNNSYS